MNTKANGANEDREKVCALIEKKNPTKADTATLRTILDRTPLPFGQFTTLGRQAEDAFLGAFTEEGPVREVIRAEMKAKRQELGFEEASPLERLLIHEVVLCFAHHEIATRQYALCLKNSPTFAQAEWNEKRISQAQRRLLRAVETLAKVQKLKLPNIQVNIAADGGTQNNIQA